mmetsp:Transcript_75635/g.130993  ORF Transcript_75635/g.130993 Transcript_75635/m.130993 type:complete len:208 (-) Transcript_75635:2084-2707(-)
MPLLAGCQHGTCVGACAHPKSRHLGFLPTTTRQACAFCSLDGEAGITSQALRRRGEHFPVRPLWKLAGGGQSSMATPSPVDAHASRGAFRRWRQWRRCRAACGCQFLRAHRAWRRLLIEALCKRSELGGRGSGRLWRGDCGNRARGHPRRRGAPSFHFTAILDTGLPAAPAAGQGKLFTHCACCARGWPRRSRALFAMRRCRTALAR